MTLEQFFTAAFRIACLLVATYLAIRGLAWLAPKVSEAARALLRGLH